MTETTIPISTEDLIFVQTVFDSGVDLYRAYDRMLPYLEPGTDQYFWFEQASIINKLATGTEPNSDNNLSSMYIIAHSSYGLALDILPIDLNTTSIAIANAVLLDILDNEGILPMTCAPSILQSTESP